MVLTLLATALSSPGQAQTSLIRMQPNPIEVKVGETAQLVIEIVDVQDLYGVDLLINFDPDVLEVVDSYTNQEGIQVNLGMFLDAGLEIKNQADNEAGTVRFVMTQLNPSLPKSGSGQLVVITLKGKKVASSSPLTFEKVQLARRDGVEIQAVFENGTAQVVWNVSEATNTSVPTQIGGTPINSLIQTITAMLSMTPTQAATSTPAPTKTKKVKNTHTSTPVRTQLSAASGAAYPAMTYTQSASAILTDAPEPIEGAQASTEASPLATDNQPALNADDSVSLPLETQAIESIGNHPPSKPTEDSDKRSSFSLLFTGIGIVFIGGIAGFGLMTFLRKR